MRYYPEEKLKKLEKYKFEIKECLYMDVTLGAASLGAVLGALLSYFVGVRQANILDKFRRRQEEVAASQIISSELRNIFNWHQELELAD